MATELVDTIELSNASRRSNVPTFPAIIKRTRLTKDITCVRWPRREGEIAINVTTGVLLLSRLFAEFQTDSKCEIFFGARVYRWT